MSAQNWHTVDQSEYRAGRKIGAADALTGTFQPGAFVNEPTDFRQGYVDGWEETLEAADAEAVR